MRMNLTIEIECGENTCASKPGQFCKYMGSVKFGQVPVCCLFPSEKETSWTLLEEKDGWVQRCKPCIDSIVALHQR